MGAVNTKLNQNYNYKVLIPNWGGGNDIIPKVKEEMAWKVNLYQGYTNKHYRS